MCPPCPPSQGITHCRCVTNPATAGCRMSVCILDSSQQIASFNSDRLDEWERNTRDFKYPHNQMSVSVKSRSEGNLQRLLMIFFFPGCLRQEFLDWIRSVTCYSILHKHNSRKQIFFTQTGNNFFMQKH
ncbi:hypothetical protein TNCV_3794411 [Trichonephila clavipes]|nr:hypothetical protein TNCV_3794411 [Trichonephila clavipes]